MHTNKPVGLETIRLTEADCLTDEQADALCAYHLGEDAYTRLVTGNTDVYKPDGSLLVRFRKNVIPHALCKLAYNEFKDAAIETDNRGKAAGRHPDGSLRKARKPGSKNTYAVAPVNSGIVGYFEASGGRHPYCRMTSFTMQHGHTAALPFVQYVSRLFEAYVPDRYACQAARVAASSPDFVIPGTVFTTLTVNRNWQTAVHKDAGDLKEGFGILTAIRSDNFDGCYLCFPKYRVAVDIRTTDLLFCDVHEWHGNTPIKAKDNRKHFRLSFVFYYREKMYTCGSAAEELVKAKARNPENFESWKR